MKLPCRIGFRRMDEYPRFVIPTYTPHNPQKLTEQTREIVCSGDRRKYTSFYCTGVYGGISTGYLVGCNLRCIFCWVSPSREYPEKYGSSYTADEAFRNLTWNARKAGVKKLRVSGGEPTLCKEHLLGLLNLVEGSNYFFVLETNGVLLGSDPGYAQAIAGYSKVYVRVSLKAGTPEGFENRTGAQKEYFKLPYKAIKTLHEAGAYMRVASMSDPRIMPAEEREAMIKRIAEIDERLALDLEEEACDPYDMTKVRLANAGFDFKE